ncbi:MAG: peptidoglycan bridge formation glycyltransferase FemA/FemB family protein [Bacteriovorax sp.]|jgi:hypothetical protein
MLNVKSNFDNSNPGSLEEWNNNLAKCINANIFSTWEWGEYKNVGWKLERLAFYNGDHFVGMIQILFKKMGPFKLGWSSSGINLVNYSYLEEIVEALSQHYDLKKAIIRINFFDEAIGDNQFYIDAVSAFRSPVVSINSGYTIRFDLNNYANSPKTYSSNNRYYLGKAVKNNLHFEVAPFTPKEFCEIHNSMASLKDLNHLEVREDDLAKLHNLFSEQLFVAKVSHAEEMLAMCAVIRWRNKAYYFLAGANENGRKLSASFLMVNKLIDYLKLAGVEEFDFGGITPFKQSAIGVNRFKIGFNGRIIRYAGERDLTANKFLYWGFNLLLRFKKIG